MKWLLLGATGVALLLIPAFVGLKTPIGFVEIAAGSIFVAVAYVRLNKPVRRRRKSGAGKIAD